LADFFDYSAALAYKNPLILAKRATFLPDEATMLTSYTNISRSNDFRPKTHNRAKPEA
jgi:hypothetical protein